jgi:hypothetical protein
MKKLAVLPALFVILATVSTFAQDVVEHNTLNYDPHRDKVIPDKVFEIGIPFLIIFLLLNAIVTIIRNRAEHQLKLRMIDKGVSDETLVKVFRESNAVQSLQPLRWFIFSAALGFAFLIIHLMREYLLEHGGGYLPVAIILFLTSIASLIYYRLLQKRQKD